MTAKRVAADMTRFEILCAECRMTLVAGPLMPGAKVVPSTRWCPHCRKMVSCEVREG